MRQMRSTLLLAALALPAATPKDAVADSTHPLAAGVITALAAAERDLDPMPFFVRPLAKRSFHKRTGLSYEEWHARLGALRPGDTPDSVRTRWPEVERALERLATDFREAPARARKSMGEGHESLPVIDAGAASRTAAVEALLAWLRPRNSP